MSVLSNAKSLAAARRKAARKEEKEAKKSISANEKKVEAVRKTVLRLLKKEVDGQHGFVVKESEWSPFGAVATIGHFNNAAIGPTGTYIGTVCVAYQSYQWRGSDESPEQTFSSLHVTLREVQNTGPALIDVTLGEGAEFTKDAAKQFEGQLALVLSKHFL